jgi:hypothetical protein
MLFISVADPGCLPRRPGSDFFQTRVLKNKISGCSSRILSLDFSILDPVVTKAPDPGSATLLFIVACIYYRVNAESAHIWPFLNKLYLMKIGRRNVFVYYVRLILTTPPAFSRDKILVVQVHRHADKDPVGI